MNRWKEQENVKNKKNGGCYLQNDKKAQKYLEAYII